MVEVNSEDKPLDDPLAAAQLEKLNLEIEHLKNKDGWEKRAALYTPLISVLIAVGGFLFGIYQFQRQQQIQQDKLVTEQQKERLSREADQAIRIKNQIRSNVEQILQFASDERQTISKVSFLLQDLKGYLEISEGQLHTDPSLNNKRNITIPLVNSVMDDCDFDRYRDVKFVFTLTDNWEDYERYLEEQKSSRALEFILDKYKEALKNVYAKDPSTIRSVRFLEDQNSYSYPNGQGKLSTAQIDHFQAIILGFRIHLGFLKDENIRERQLSRFQGAMCNGAFMQQYFGIKYGSTSAPEEFARCPK